MRGLLAGKVVLVTGAGRGLGRAIAVRAAQCGAHVGVIDIDGEAIDRTCAEIRSRGCYALGAIADVANWSDVGKAIGQFITRFGRVDGLVNNAGILQDAFVTDISDADWDRMLAVNLKGVFNSTRLVLPTMLERRSGAIVNIASMGAKSSWPLTGAHYSASKGGVIAFTKQVAKQVGPFGVRVNAVAPGTAATEMISNRSPEQIRWIVDHIPLGRLADPADVAAAVVFLLSDWASYITGYTLDLNGGAYVD